ncbi:MAG: 16S rRNA processing protein RimM [Flavobacteriales bacterium]|nr:16S rRNA processing protein RimM [Flavobacteriales bacterium]
MNKADCFVLGKLTKPHGYKGAMVLFIDADEPKEYSALEAVWVEVGERLVPHFIDAMRPHNTSDKFVVELEGVDNEARAKAIAGCTVYLPTSMLPQLEGNTFYLHEVISWTVTDAQGDTIGTIRKVLDYAMYPILEVQTEAHNKEVLIPLPAQIHVRVNRAAKSLAVDLPQGLLEAYLGSEETNDDEGEWWDGDESP